MVNDTRAGMKLDKAGGAYSAILMNGFTEICHPLRGDIKIRVLDPSLVYLKFYMYTNLHTLRMLRDSDCGKARWGQGLCAGHGRQPPIHRRPYGAAPRRRGYRLFPTGLLSNTLGTPQGSDHLH